METISLKSLIQVSPTPLAFFDIHMNLTEHSYLWCAAFDLKEDCIKGKSFFALFPETTQEMKRSLEACLQGVSYQIKEYKVILKDYSLKWFDWHMAPIKNDKNRIVGIVVSANDITARKKENDLLKMVKKVAKTGGWELNLITKTFFWTTVTKEIFEVSQDHLPDKEDAKLFFKEGFSRNELARVRQEAIEKGTPFDIELELISAQNNEKWVRLKGKTEFKNNKCSRIYGTIQDINDRKQDELKYHAEAERLKLAMKTSEVGTWEVLLPDRLATWDDICYKLHGIEKSKCTDIYKDWISVLPPEDFNRVVKEAYLLYEKKVSNSIEYRVKNEDNSFRHLRVMVTFIRVESDFKANAIGIVMDITKEKEAEKKLQEFAELRKKQNEHLTSFARMVSHDLRAHSSNLSMVANFLIDEKSDEEKLKLLGMLKNATDSLVNTVCNLNTIVQSTSEVPEQMEELNLLEAIQRAQNNISSLIKESLTKLILNVSRNHTVNALPAYLDSILLNLLTNSVKYSAADRKPIIKIHSEQVPNYLKVLFTDNGRGIDLKTHGKSIFGMHKTFHRNQDAMGVGLYLTKNQMETMGGKISVESTVGVGTTFTLLFSTNCTK